MAREPGPGVTGRKEGEATGGTSERGREGRKATCTLVCARARAGDRCRGRAMGTGRAGPAGIRCAATSTRQRRGYGARVDDWGRARGGWAGPRVLVCRL